MQHHSWYLLRSPGCLERILSTQASESRSEKVFKLTHLRGSLTHLRGCLTHLRGRGGARRGGRLCCPGLQPAVSCWVNLAMDRIHWVPFCGWDCKMYCIVNQYRGWWYFLLWWWSTMGGCVTNTVLPWMIRQQVTTAPYWLYLCMLTQTGPMDNVRAVSPEEPRHHSRESIGQSNDPGAAPSETPEQMLPNLILVDWCCSNPTWVIRGSRIP